MKHRSLGNTGIHIAPLVLGGNVFGWTADEPTSFELLDRSRVAHRAARCDRADRERHDGTAGRQVDAA
jgi:hypothetical protein